MSDPTVPLSERTPQELDKFISSHIIMALLGAEYLQSNRQAAFEYVRARLIAVSATYPDRDALEAEDERRRYDRLFAAIGISDEEAIALGRAAQARDKQE